MPSPADPTLQAVRQLLTQVRSSSDARRGALALSIALERYRPGLSSIVGGAAQGMMGQGAPADLALETALYAAVRSLATRGEVGLGFTEAQSSLGVSIVSGITSMITGVLGMVNTISANDFASRARDHQRYLETGAATAALSADETAYAFAREAARRGELVAEVTALMPGQQLLPGDDPLALVRGRTLPVWSYFAIGGGALALVGVVGYALLR